MEEHYLELVLSGPAHGGTCVSRDADGRVVFVRFGLPGERVRARVTKEQSNLAWAEVVEVLEASPDRVEGALVDQLKALGADLAHVDLPAARAWKRQVLVDVLRRVGGEELSARVRTLYGEEGPPVQAAPRDADRAGWAVGSRTRARFVVDGQGRLGMRRFRSSEIIPVLSFPLLDPRFDEAGLFGGPGKEVAHEEWAERWRPGDPVELVAPNGSDPVVLIGKKQRAWTLAGEASREDAKWKVQADGTEAVFSVEPGGFWQIHPDAPSILASAVLQAAAPLEGATVVELYSGSGLLSYFLAANIGPTGRLLTLEGSRGAVAAAEKNLRAVNQAGNVEFFQGAVSADAVRELAQQVGGHFDVAVMDPPRTGAKAGVLGAVAETSPGKIVLVSCDPAAGARDLAALMRAGYELEDLQAWDIFPHTHHLEMVSSLTGPRP